MATVSRNGRTPETVRREIEMEKRELEAAVEQLKDGLGDATDVAGKLRGRAPGRRRGRPRRGLLPRRRDRRDDALPRPQGPRALSADVGHTPSSPWRFSAREWANVFKRAFKSFLADDAMGMSAQVAFSSLLAFFPAMVFLVGLLDLIGAYETLQEFLAPVAPGDVLETIDTLQQETTKGTSVVAFIVGAAGATWAASGAMNAVIKAVNRAYDRVETRPFWKTRIVAIVLVALTGLVLAGLLLLIVFGGPLGTAIADKARLGGAFELFWAVLRWPIAFVAILLFFALVYYLAPNVDVRSWKWLTPGSLVGQRLVARALRPVRPLHELLGLVLEDLRRAGERDRAAALAQLLRVRAALRRGAELGARQGGRDPRRRRGGRRADQAQPTCLGRDPDLPLHLRGAEIGVEAERAGGELDLPGERARGGEAGLAVDTLADQVGVVQLRAVAHE